MKRHDDPFYELIREGLHDYTATPPEGAYAGIRQKLNKGAFFRFSWYRMNVYFAALLAGGVVLAALMLNPNAEDSALAKATPVNLDPKLNIEREATVTEEVDAPSAAVEQPEVAVQVATRPKPTTQGSAQTASVANSDYRMNSSDEDNGLLAAGHTETTEETVIVNCDEADAPPAPELREANTDAQTQDLAKIEARQLPTDWLQHAGSPDLNQLLTDLESDKETIYITLPVKVKVEKED